MKSAVKILIVGMVLVILGVILRINGVETAAVDSWLMGVGLLLEFFAVIQLVKLVFYTADHPR